VSGVLVWPLIEVLKGNHFRFLTGLRPAAPVAFFLLPLLSFFYVSQIGQFVNKADFITTLSQDHWW
jgi:hypothetical protein